MPELENVINNYMQCSQLIFGTKGWYCLSFKNELRNFYVHQRKLIHSYSACITDEDLDHSIGVKVGSLDGFLVSKGNEILLYS